MKEKLTDDTTDDSTDLRGTPESWHCIDCDFNTAPGMFGRAELEAALAALTGPDEGVPQRINNRSEIYTVRDVVWFLTGVAPMGGCLCVGCLEKRIGRRLKPEDFPHDRGFNLPTVPCTPRLRKRRGYWRTKRIEEVPTTKSVIEL
jgi:hypothetical protein